MEWIKLLPAAVGHTYKPTDNMMAMLSDDDLHWKPATGNNWMTVGQLLKHLTESCGFCCKGFATGDWGMPEGECSSDGEPVEMLPPAEKLPAVGSVAEARQLLEADRLLALKTIEEAGEDRLENEMSPAPWAPENPKCLGQHCLEMVGHLDSHKSQLFYYLKLMGKDVNTMTLWGM